MYFSHDFSFSMSKNYLIGALVSLYSFSFSPHDSLCHFSAPFSWILLLFSFISSFLFPFNHCSMFFDFSFSNSLLSLQVSRVCSSFGLGNIYSEHYLDKSLVVFIKTFRRVRLITEGSLGEINDK